MVRMRSFEGFAVPQPRKSAVVVNFIGPLGQGVGLAADILEHVAQAATHAVLRERRVADASHGAKTRPDGMLHVVRMEAAAARHRAAAIADSAEITVAWSVEAALAFAHLLKSPNDFFLLQEDRIPSWRRDLTHRAAHEVGTSDSHGAGVLSAVRALGMISRRLPFDDLQWHEIVAQHVPTSMRGAAVDHFAAAAW